MNTVFTTYAVPLEKAIPIAQLVHDVSHVASGWFLRPAGFDPETWYVELLSEPRFSPTAASGLDSTASGHIEAYWHTLLEYRPRTTLGQRLWDIRARILASREPLLSWEDIDRELAERRGERSSHRK